MTKVKIDGSSSSPSGRWASFLLQFRIAQHRRRLNRHSPRSARLAAQIPDSVRLFCLASADEELPGWQPDEADWILASAALMQFFECCQLKTSDRPCALPSRAADAVWHLWLAHDASGLEAFQRHHFAQLIPHIEADQLGADLESALARSWAMACRGEGRSPLDCRLPLMFRVDRMLRTPTGWAYQTRLLQGQVMHRNLDSHGNELGRLHLHAGMGLASLAAQGLLTEQELAAQERRQKASNSGGGDCSFGGSSDGSDCSGDAAGCTCGSGCGS